MKEQEQQLSVVRPPKKNSPRPAVGFFDAIWKALRMYFRACARALRELLMRAEALFDLSPRVVTPR